MTKKICTKIKYINNKTNHRFNYKLPPPKEAESPNTTFL